MSNPISINLRRLRKMKDLTQAQLAENAGISRNAYRSIETGGSTPRASTLESIARALKVSVFDLTAEVPRLNALRFRSLKSLTASERAEREQIKVDVATWLSDFNEVEELVGDRIPYRFQDLNHPSSPEDAASEARRLLELEGGECVPDICSLLENSGIKVHLLNSHLKNFFGLSVGPEDGGPAIAVNIEDRITVERRIFTAAHELGHLILHMESYYSDQDEEDDLQENEADIFASYFLMPRDRFGAVWSEGRGLDWIDNVLHTKRRFHVSYKTVLKRLIDEFDVDNTIYREFSQQYRKRHGKRLAFREEPESYVASKDEPNLLDSIDFIEDRLSRLVRDALEKELISIGRAAEILNISVSAMKERAEEWEIFR